jgi:hypothetical protein
MSRPKFAQVTASLLARKGEARPWPGMDVEARTYDWQGDTPELLAHAALDQHQNGAPIRHDTPVHNGAHLHDGDKRYAIRMSAKEFERLGIIAVKRSVTRQHLMREMLEQYLQSAASQYCADCTCLDGEDCAR